MKFVHGAEPPDGAPPGWERGERRSPAGGESGRGSAGTLTGGAWPGSVGKGRNSGAIWAFAGHGTATTHRVSHHPFMVKTVATVTV